MPIDVDAMSTRYATLTSKANTLIVKAITANMLKPMEYPYSVTLQS